MSLVDVFTAEMMADVDFSKPSVYLFKRPVDFSEYIEMFARSHDSTITAALIEYCELVDDLEYEDLSSMLTENIKQKIALEMQDEGLLPKTNQISFE